MGRSFTGQDRGQLLTTEMYVDIEPEKMFYRSGKRISSSGSSILLWQLKVKAKNKKLIREREKKKGNFGVRR